MCLTYISFFVIITILKWKWRRIEMMEFVVTKYDNCTFCGRIPIMKKELITDSILNFDEYTVTYFEWYMRCNNCDWNYVTMEQSERNLESRMGGEVKKIQNTKES